MVFHSFFMSTTVQPFAAASFNQASKPPIGDLSYANSRWASVWRTNRHARIPPVTRSQLVWKLDGN